MAEELVQHEFRREGADAQHVKPAGPLTEIVDILGEERLAAAALAVQHDRCGRGREHVRQTHDFRHHRREPERPSP